MPANIYPLVVGDPTLKSCRHSAHQGDRRVAAPAMCPRHLRTCFTCCISRLKRRCWEGRIGEIEVAAALAAKSMADGQNPTEPIMTWEESQGEIAKICHQLGFRPETEAEMAQNARWRTR